jgi:cytochrome c-550 PedF
VRQQSLKHLIATLAALAVLGSNLALAHDISLQPVDTTGLDPLGPDWRTENPYRGKELAVTIGASGYNQNCARCHGLEVISGGIAPDLRALEKDKTGDTWFINRIRHGATINGTYKMPPFEGILSQEAMWAIRTYIESRPIE